MTLPPAILFDLDDTILAAGSRPAFLLEVAFEFAEELRPLDPEVLAEQLEVAFAAHWSDAERQRAGRMSLEETRRHLVVAALDQIGCVLSAEIGARFADRFSRLREERIELFPTARETLLGLTNRGVKLALVTNGAAHIQRAKIERFELAAFFDHIQIEGEQGFGKPEQRAYVHALQALGAEPSDVWMVGDNLEWEVAAPQRLGIYSIWHDWQGKGLPPGTDVKPDRIITRLGELLTEPGNSHVHSLTI